MQEKKICDGMVYTASAALYKKFVRYQTIVFIRAAVSNSRHIQFLIVLPSDNIIITQCS